MSLQGEAQAAIRAVTETTGAYNEDLLAFVGGTGTYNERLIKFLKTATGSTATSLPALQAKAAKQLGKNRWDDLGASITDLWAKTLFDGSSGFLFAPRPGTTYLTDSGNTNSGDNDPFGLLEDLSGGGNNATQSVSASRPVLTQDGSRYHASYDGVDDYLDLGVGRIGNTGLFCDANEQFCVAGAVRSADTSTAQGIISKRGGDSADATFNVFFQGGDFALRLREGVITVLLPSANNGEWIVFLINWDGSAATGMANSLTPVTCSVGANVEGSETIKLGTHVPTGGFLDGDIGGTFLIDKSLDSATQTQVMRYLAAKVGKAL